MPRNVLLPCVISRRACDVATGAQLKNCGGKKRIQFVSLLVFQGDTFSFQSSSLNPTRYCVTRAMKQLFSYKSAAVRRNSPSSVFYCCCFFNHVVWLQAMSSFQTTFVNRWGGLKCRKHLRETLFRASFQFFTKWNLSYLFFMLICNHLHLFASINIIAIIRTEDLLK